MKMPGNLFLIGPMAAGKSTVGRQLASLTGKSFVDADQELEKRTGASISLIFDIEGEAGFRKRESTLIDELTQGQDMVLATGGGAVLDEANRRVLHSRGFVIYLHAEVDALVERTRNDRSRPLLQGVDREKKLLELMAEREPLYRQEADLVIDTGLRSASAVARDIIKQIESLEA